MSLEITAIHPYDLFELLSESDAQPAKRGSIKFAWYQDHPEHEIAQDILEVNGKLYLETAHVAYKSTKFEQVSAAHS